MASQFISINAGIEVVNCREATTESGATTFIISGKLPDGVVAKVYANGSLYTMAKKGELQKGVTGIISAEVVNVEVTKKGAIGLTLFGRQFVPTAAFCPLCQATVSGGLVADIRVVPGRDGKPDFRSVRLGVTTKDQEKESKLYLQFTTNNKIDPAKHSKGDNFVVLGPIKFDKWADKEGKERIDIKVRADYLGFGEKVRKSPALSGGDSDDFDDFGEEASTKSAPPAAGNVADDDDDGFFEI